MPLQLLDWRSPKGREKAELEFGDDMGQGRQQNQRLGSHWGRKGADLGCGAHMGQGGGGSTGTGLTSWGSCQLPLCRRRRRRRRRKEEEKRDTKYTASGGRERENSSPFPSPTGKTGGNAPAPKHFWVNSWRERERARAEAGTASQPCPAESRPSGDKVRSRAARGCPRRGPSRDAAAPRPPLCAVPSGDLSVSRPSPPPSSALPAAPRCRAVPPQASRPPRRSSGSSRITWKTPSNLSRAGSRTQV